MEQVHGSATTTLSPSEIEFGGKKGEHGKVMNAELCLLYARSRLKFLSI